jgi:hypothetical protein
MPEADAVVAVVLLGCAMQAVLLGVVSRRV